MKKKDNKVLVKDNKINERSKNYFNKSFNYNQNGDIDGQLKDTRSLKNTTINYCRRIRIIEVKEVLSKMRLRIAI